MIFFFTKIGSRGLKKHDPHSYLVKRSDKTFSFITSIIYFLSFLSTEKKIFL